MWKLVTINKYTNILKGKRMQRTCNLWFSGDSSSKWVRISNEIRYNFFTINYQIKETFLVLYCIKFFFYQIKGWISKNKKIWKELRNTLWVRI